MIQCKANLPNYIEGSNGGSFSQKRILIVDDESFNIIAIKSMMKGLKFANLKTHVDSVFSGEDAIELLKKNISFVGDSRRQTFQPAPSREFKRI